MPDKLKGTVKWFDRRKGYGFVSTENDERDIFVHYTSIQRQGYRFLKEDQEIEFELCERDKGPYAANVIIPRKGKERS